MNRELNEKLHHLAEKKSTPFCYGCYIPCPKGICPLCASDDLMRILPNDGPEYGTDWIIESLITQHCTPINLEELFESHIDDCYGENIQVAWMTLSTVTVMKECDPIGFQCAQSEYRDNLESEGEIMTFDNGGEYYWINEIEEWVEGES